ncbi:Glycosyltransferase 25 (LPS biosynthesis protein) family protein [Aspergillus niger]|nr:Glycosyltransferase 25 (LPS biosynthesis protein) family protein [Aspergillus niger]
MAKSLFVSIFIAVSFFHAGSTLQGLQNQMIALLLLFWIISTPCADFQDIWFRKWATFTARDECDGRLLVLSYSVDDEYLDALDYSYGQCWSVCGLCCTNFVLVYAMVWFTLRGEGRDMREDSVKRWVEIGYV